MDKAKKDLEEIRQSLVCDDSIPDLERLMEMEKAKISKTTVEAERLLVTAGGKVQGDSIPAWKV